MPQFSSDGVKLYYMEAGIGAPVVFIHEFAGDYRSWEQQIRYFSRRYRCIAYNARGYPPSQSPPDPDSYTQEVLCNDLQALLDHLDLDRAYLIGLSMGSFTALQLALKVPSRVQAMVLAATGYGASSDQTFQQEALALAEQIERLGVATVASEYAVGPARLPFKRKDPRGWQEFANQFAHHSPEGAALILRGCQARRQGFRAIEAQLRQLQVPTLIIAGDDDEKSLEPSIYLKNVLPGAGLAVIPQSGHSLNLEEPMQFNTLVQEFLATVETRRWEIQAAP